MRPALQLNTYGDVLCFLGLTRATQARMSWYKGPILVGVEDPAAVLVDSWQPKGIVSPWLGGSLVPIRWSGEHPTTVPLSAADAGVVARLAGSPLGDALDEAAQLAARAVERRWTKAEMVLAARSSLPDSTVEWCDTCFHHDGPNLRWLPILGGGNDAQVNYSSVYGAAAAAIVTASIDRRLEWAQALLDDSETSADAGTYEAVGVLSTRPVYNPWWVVLAIEGAMTFAGTLSSPTPWQWWETTPPDFRAEVWIPMHDVPMTWDEYRYQIGTWTPPDGWSNRVSSVSDVVEALVHQGWHRAARWQYAEGRRGKVMTPVHGGVVAVAHRDLWTVADIAVYLSVAEQSVRNMRTRGKLPAPTLDEDGRPLWLPTAIEAWAADSGRR